jgi:hypothetical protein
MTALWLTLTYLTDRVSGRIQAVREGDPESGAVTLEWIIIAVALAVIAATATGLFVASVNKQTSKLP